MLEVSISLFLLSILLTGLFSFLTHIPKADRFIREEKKKIFHQEEIQIRLQQILSKCLCPFDEEFYFDFDENTNTLTFHFHQGIDKDPDFSGPVKTSLYVDRQENLCLEYFSLQNMKKSRKEILLSGIVNMQFQFFEKNLLCWKKTISKEENQLPLMIKMKASTQDFSVDYTYLFCQNHPIEYVNL